MMIEDGSDDAAVLRVVIMGEVVAQLDTNFSTSSCAPSPI